MIADVAESPRAATAEVQIEVGAHKAEQPATTMRSKKRRLLFTAAAVTAALVVAGVLLYVFVRQDGAVPPPQVHTSASASNASSDGSSDEDTLASNEETDPVPQFTGSFGGGWRPQLGAQNLGNIPGLSGVTDLIVPDFPALPSFGSAPEAGWTLPDLPDISVPTVFAPLKSAAVGTGRLIGAIHNEGRVWKLNDAAETARYEQHLIDQYDIITPENACKTAPMFPTGLASPVWTTCDRIVAWTRENGLKMRFHGAGGHTLGGVERARALVRAASQLFACARPARSRPSSAPARK